MSSAYRIDDEFYSERRWSVGDALVVDGIPFRVVQGAKAADDLRLDMSISGDWRAVSMRLGFFLADFFYENEDVLYPPGEVNGNGTKNQGGNYYLRQCRLAAVKGWGSASQLLEAERAAKQLRLDVPFAERAVELIRRRDGG